MVEAEFAIEQLRPLATSGDSLRLYTRLVGVQQKRRGALVLSESELRDADEVCADQAAVGRGPLRF